MWAPLCKRTHNTIATIIGPDRYGREVATTTCGYRTAVRMPCATPWCIAAVCPPARVETRWTGEGRPNVQTGNEAAITGNRVVDIEVH